MSSAAAASSVFEISLSVQSEWETRKLILSGKQYDYIVSITDPGAHDTNFMALLALGLKATGGRLLCLEFADVDDVDSERPNAPNKTHLDKILQLASDMKKEGKSKPEVLCHCHAGASRSTAAAYILQRELGYCTEDAIQHMLRTSPIACPNPVLLGMYEGDDATMAKRIAEL
jgi:predicted protein tyrosine phosphatase